jgi:hypothetical protein
MPSERVGSKLKRKLASALFTYAGQVLHFILLDETEDETSHTCWSCILYHPEVDKAGTNLSVDLLSPSQIGQSPSFNIAAATMPKESAGERPGIFSLRKTTTKYGRAELFLCLNLLALECK